MRRLRTRAVESKGDLAKATIVGIRIEAGSDMEGHDRMPTFRYALDVAAPQPFTCGVEARLEPLEHVRLGQVVQVVHHKGRALITENAAPGLTATHVSPCSAPTRGVDDDFIWLGNFRKGGRPAQITILDARSEPGVLGSSKVVLTLRVQGNDFATFDTELERPQLRPYASHLEHVGLTLPGWARPGKRTDVVIDWAAAAVAKPGTGQPPGPIRALLHAALPEVAPIDISTEALSADTDALPPIEGVDFRTWATVVAVLQLNKVKQREHGTTAQTYGIPAARWATVNSGWNRRLAKDWKLSAAAEAIRDEVKRER